MIRCDGGEYRLIERPIDPPLEPHLPPLQRTLLQAIDFANPFMTEEKPASVLVGCILDWSAVVRVCLCGRRINPGGILTRIEDVMTYER